MRLDIATLSGGRCVVVRLSQRNLLTLLSKLDMPGSARTILSENCFQDGVPVPLTEEAAAASAIPRTILVVRCEDDDEHYASRLFPPGEMHPQSEAFVSKRGASADELDKIAADAEPTWLTLDKLASETDPILDDEHEEPS